MTTVRKVCPIQILLHVHTVDVEGSLREEASLALILSAFSTSLAIWAAAKEVKYHCLLNYVAHHTKFKIIQIIIQCKCFFLFVGWKPNTGLANNCLQIMVCSCTKSFNCFWLQIPFCSCINETTLFSFLRSLLPENGRSLRFPKIFVKKLTLWSNDKTIIELGHHKILWFVSVS